MEYIDQKIGKLNISGIDIEEIDDNCFSNREEFYIYLKKMKGLIFITAVNGVGKTSLLKFLNKAFKDDDIKCNFKELKYIHSLEELKTFMGNDVVLLDGLDELDYNINHEVKDYIINNYDKEKLLIVSGRKDYLQKESIISIKNNIYEIYELSKEKVREVLKKNGIIQNRVERIIDILSVPRFLDYVVDRKEFINSNKNISKFDLLDLIVKKHIDELSFRGKISLEKSIHKRILQSLALIMVISQKYKISSSDFTLFLSRINNLDVKMYIMNEKLIDAFLNNQLLINDGEFIYFESKEIMEFLAAKEILENNYSNEQLSDLILVDGLNDINVYWFNVLNYVISRSEIYRNLFLDFFINNLNKNNVYLDFLLNCDYVPGDWNFVKKSLIPLIKKYTKLYQYLDNWNRDLIFKNIMMTNPTGVFELICDTLSKIEFEKELDDYTIIFVNNLFTCLKEIINFVESYSKDKLNKFLKDNSDKIIINKSIRVRYLYLCFDLLSNDEISLIISNHVDDRIVSLILYNGKDLKKFDGYDRYVNDYILNDYNKQINNLYISEYEICEYLFHYNAKRIRNLIHMVDSTNIDDFLSFINDCDYDKMYGFLNKKSVVKDIYEFIFIKIYYGELIIDDGIFFADLREKAMLMIVSLCIENNFIDSTLLQFDTSNNYIVENITDMIIRFLLLKNKNIKEIYDNLFNKFRLYIVWRQDLNINDRKSYEKEIKKLYPDEYKITSSVHEITEKKMNDRIVEKINTILISKNIEDKIYNLYELIKSDDDKLDEHNRIVLSPVVKEIYNYVKNLNIEKIISTNCSDYSFYQIFTYYDYSIYILLKNKYNIKEFNFKSIFSANIKDTIGVELNYTESDFSSFINSVKENCSKGYLKYGFSHILDLLKNDYKELLFSLLFEWLEKYSFEDYFLNIIFNFISKNLSYLDEVSLSLIKEYDNKFCDDILIYYNFEPAILKRVNYIKEKKVFEGDYINSDQDSGFEYSSHYFTDPLTKIEVKYINYVEDLAVYAFEKYNSGNYYGFLKYILEFVNKFVENNSNELKILEIIELLKVEMSKCKDQYLYYLVKSMIDKTSYREKSIMDSIILLNRVNEYDKCKIFNYSELVEYVKKVIENDLIGDLNRMNFFRMFKNENSKLHILEESYQFIIGYELRLKMNSEGFKTKIVYESMAIDKKRNDIQLLSEGFVENVIIEVKLSTNKDLLKSNIGEYINKLRKYSDRFSSPKVIFAIVNQNSRESTIKEQIKNIKENDKDNFIVPIIIEVKSLIDKINKES